MSEASAPPRPAAGWRDVDGILLLDKPEGLSSNAALQRVRRLYRARKAGHTGSLDPLASGLLPVCFGQATKISGMLLDADKTYRATAVLGIRTTTGDAEGEVIEHLPVPALDPARVQAVMDGFLSGYEQVPPMYSALKHEGQRLYRLARQGLEVERRPRPAPIRRLALQELAGDRLAFEVDCGKGTYVRTLVEDLARALGTTAHVGSLRRLRLGSFGAESMQALADLEQAAEGSAAGLESRLLPVDAALAGLPEVRLGAAEQACVLQGQAVFAAGPGGRRVRMYGPEGRFLGVGRMTPEGQRLAPERLMVRLPAGNGISA